MRLPRHRVLLYSPAMDTLSLPVVKVGTSLRGVMKRMRATGRSGAVYLEGNQYRLVKAPDVVIRMAENPKANLRSLPHKPIRAVDVAQVARKTPGPTMHVHTLTVDLEKSQAGLGVLASDEKTVLLTTLSKKMHNLLISRPADCYCSKTGERVAGCQDGDPCPEKDGGTVRCG
jgi:hypothetical protein